MRRWVPTLILMVTILTTAGSQRDISVGPCAPALLSRVLASAINYRYDWRDQTVQRFSEQVLRANPFFAALKDNPPLAWRIKPRGTGCVVSAIAKLNGKIVGCSDFYVDLDKNLIFPHDKITTIYVDMVTSDPILLASATRP